MTKTRPLLTSAGLTCLVVVTGCASSSPSVSPAANPTATPTQTANESAAMAQCTGRGIAAGTYRLSATDTETIPATFTVPAGWSGCGLITKEFGPPAGPALIGFWLVENVYADPCHWDGGQMDPAVGPTAADLAAAMVDQAVTEAAAPTATTLGGHPASYVRVVVPDNVDVSDCDAVTIREFRFWKGPGEERTGSAVWWLGAADAAGLIGEVWAVDLDGTRVVVQAAYFSDAGTAEVHEIHQIVESISFSP